MSKLIYVPGEGGLRKGLVFIGEAPGATEEALQKPFVGQAGEVLDRYLKYVGITRSDIYITNVVKVRPEDNRTPTDEEIATWRVPLLKELTALERYGESFSIVTLGLTAAKAMLGEDIEKMGQVSGAIQYGCLDYKIVCTYHPAYILRSPDAFNEVKKDLDIVSKLMLQ